MKIRVISLFLAIVMTILLIPAPVHADAVSDSQGERLLQQIRQTYANAQRGSGIYSFNGLCGTMVSWQTYLLGMDSKMYPYDGNKAFDTYRWKEYSGEYSVESFPASRYNLRSALNTITKNGTKDAFNILVGFQWTHTEAGARYGHAVFIHGIIDGMVYFMESYNATFGGKYYREGTPIVCSIDTFCKYYSTWTALDGVIHFGVKSFAELCESYPSNMTAISMADTSVFEEPAEEGEPLKQIGELHVGSTVRVTRLYRTPGGSFWYELALDSGIGYVQTDALFPVDAEVTDVALEGLSIPGVLRKGAGAVLKGAVSSQSGAMKRLEVLVYAAGQDAPVLQAAADVSGHAVYLSDKQIDRALSFRKLPVGIYDIVIRAEVENNILENGQPVSQRRWEELRKVQVQVVSNWNRYATVTFNGNGGEAEIDQTGVLLGTALQQLPTAVREGYEFMGWSLRPDGSQPVNGKTAISGNTTLYAVWQKEGPETDGGSWSTVNGLLLYRDKDGNAPSGWALIDGRYHYFNEAGMAMSGWQEIDGNRYYLNADGSKVWGWQTIDGVRYYFRADGMQREMWLEHTNQLYYLDQNGKMVTGRVLIGDMECHFGKDGKLCLTKQNNGTTINYVVYDRHVAQKHLAPGTMLLLA